MRTNGTSSIAETPARGRGSRIALLLGIVAFMPHALHSGGRDFTVLVKGNLTTSSQIFLNPDAADIITRQQSLALTDFFGVGVEVKYHISETNIAVGISADYIRARASTSLPVYPRQEIPVEDGYTVIPVEMTGYFIIPLSGETFGVFMGGGGGLYFGKRTYLLGETEAPLLDSTPGFGIHVLGGVSYRIFGGVEAVFEMKFRDLQFESRNSFKESSIHYNNLVVNVSKQPFKSRTQTDGIVFQLGIAYSF